MSHENQLISPIFSRRNFLRGVGIVGGLAAAGWAGYDFLKIEDQIDVEVERTIPSMPKDKINNARHEVVLFQNGSENAAREGDLSLIQSKFNGQKLKEAYQVLDQDSAIKINQYGLSSRLYSKRLNLFSKEFNAAKRNAVIGFFGAIIASISLVYGDNKASNVSITQAG